MTTNKKAAPAEAAQNTANSNTCDHITVLESYGPRLTKLYASSGATLPYEDAASFKVKAVEVTGLKGLAKLLAKLHPRKVVGTAH